jgi:hypothetical protein
MSKKIYIYEYVDELTTNYHDGGGLVIITGADPQEALDNERAELAEKHGAKLRLTKLPEPDRVIEIPDTEQDAIIEFPDTGCC